MLTTTVFDGPWPTPHGGQMTRVVTYDEHGCEIGWFGIDAAGFGYDATAEHPDREFLGWPEGIDQPFSFYNDVEEGWACPSYEAAQFACLYENAVRLDEGWYVKNDNCAMTIDAVCRSIPDDLVACWSPA